MDDFVHNTAFSDLRKKMANQLRNYDSIKVGSMFTGWGVLEMVMSCLQREWNDAKPASPLQATVLHAQLCSGNLANQFQVIVDRTPFILSDLLLDQIGKRWTHVAF